jgi:CelD/BcsL family acetyltransferase involved in cellulose biosynthesis
MALLDTPAVPEGNPPRRASAPLSVELTSGLDLGFADAAGLDRLLSSRSEIAVFLSRPWLSGFAGDAPAGVEPRFVIFRQRGVLRGVVPIAIRKALTHVRVSLLGGSFGSDRVDLIAARGFEAAASDAFVQWLADSFGRTGFLLELRDVPATSPLWGGIHRALEAGTLRGALQPREVSTLPYLDLRERPGPAVSTTPASQTARSLEKHRRWLENRCQLRIDVLGEPGEVMDAFGSLVQFLHARWRGAREGSALDDARTRRFHQTVLPLLLRAGSLRMIRLSADGARTIAVFYGIASGPWWGYYLCGYDREWAGRIHLGQVTLAAAIDCARAEGAREFDFLKGAHRNKYSWPVRERTTLDADLFSDGPGAQLIRAARAARDAAAAAGKSARHFFSS